MSVDLKIIKRYIHRIEVNSTPSNINNERVTMKVLLTVTRTTAALTRFDEDFGRINHRRLSFFMGKITCLLNNLFIL